MRLGVFVLLFLLVFSSLVGAQTNGLTNGSTQSNSVTQSNGQTNAQKANGSNGHKTDGLTQPNGTTKPNGLTQPNGTTKPNGLTQPNGTTKSNGLTQPNGQKANAPVPPSDTGSHKNLAALLKFSNEMLTREPVRKLLRATFRNELRISPAMQERYSLPKQIREITESQFLEIITLHPEIVDLFEKYLSEVPADKMMSRAMAPVRRKWRAEFAELVKRLELKKLVKQMVRDPLRPFTITPQGQDGWTKMEFYANHETILNGQSVPPADLKAQVLRALDTATKEVGGNVYDFDLKDIAQELIDKGESGIEVRFGVDKQVVESRPETKAVIDMLNGKKNITITLVDSVSLNHQKLIAIDWSVPENAKTILLSGNLTQSCIGPEGDGINLPVRPEEARPNANHMFILHGQDVAMLVNHEISKTIDPQYQLRGKEYPLSGAYRIMGPQIPGEPPQFLIMAFTPGGGLGDVNRDLISQVISRSDGTIRMVQFAASSKTISGALFEKMKEQVMAGKKFDFGSVGDTSFSMAEWSIFLEMSGLAVETLPDGTKRWVELPDNPWKQTMGEKAYQELRDKIMVAPEVYGHHYAKQPDGTLIEFTSKVHHKILLAKINGRWVGVQGSYNFSEIATRNQEYITLFFSKEAAEYLLSIYEGLKAMTVNSVEKMAGIRNSRRDERDPNRKVIRDSESIDVLESGRKVVKIKSDVSTKPGLCRAVVGF